jgi:flagellin
VSITIGSNIASLEAQERFAATSREASCIFERLSSGLRINRASDDAAGLAVAADLRADTRVFNQGVRNLNDGISAVSIADAALDQMASTFGRIGELSEQAATGTLSSVQRASLNQEAQRLTEEYQRIVSTTSFNGQNLLDGSVDTIAVQAGYSPIEIMAPRIGTTTTQGGGGGSTISTVQWNTSNIVYSGVSGLTAGDLDQNGTQDLVVQTSSDIRSLSGNGSGGFSNSSTLFLPGGETADSSLQSLALGSVYGGSDPDLGYSYSDSGGGKTLEWARAGGGLGFTDQGGLSIGAGGVGPVAVIAADLDSNGTKEIIGVAASGGGSHNGGIIDVLQGNSFFSIAGGIDYLAAGEFSGGGDLDLVALDTAITTVRIYTLVPINNQATLMTTVTASSNPTTAPVVADVDGDGKADVLFGASDGTINIFRGNNDTTFQARTTITPSGAPTWLAVRDVNGDGKVDLVASTGSGFDLLLGNGDGTFASPVPSTVTPSRGFVIADFTGDGVLDIAGVDGSGNARRAIGGNSTVTIPGTQTYDVFTPLNPSVDLTTAAAARSALDLSRIFIDTINLERGKLGAFQQRLGVAISTLSTSVENYAAAASRITDADIAFEAAGETRQSILQQAGAVILAQANQEPTLALELLRA